MAEAAADSGCYVYSPSSNAQPAPEQSKSRISDERLDAFLQIWTPTEETLNQVLASADSGSVNQVCAWLSSLQPRILDRIPTGLITTSTASSLHTKVAAQADEDTHVISIPATQCSNLKSVLKCIVSTVASQVSSQARLLNYDLETLHSFVEERQFAKVLLYFGNGESLHGGVLSDLVDVLSSWRDRIPFVLLFETAVSVQLFQEKLTKQALRCLRGEAFATASAGDVAESIFKAAATSRQQRLWMGANPAAMLTERQTEHLQSAQAFVRAVKYMHMIHFFRNPLSVLLCDTGAPWTDEMFEAASNLKSLQNQPSDAKKQKKAKDAAKPGKDRQYLSELATKSLEEGHRCLTNISIAVQLLHTAHEVSSASANLSWSKLYVQAMSGQMPESPTLRNLLLAIRTMPSDSMTLLLTRLVDLGIPDIEPLLSKLSELVTEHSEAGPLRSEQDKSLETTRTTVVAKKISLSKQKTALSKGDKEYSSLVKQISSSLEDYLKSTLINPKSLPFNEVFVFDLRVPLREAFAPRPRHALEHALTVPGAYLACECCEPDQRGLSGTHPATSILYQLYLESGAIVNIADLWAAFETVISDSLEESADEDVAVEDQKLALFYQALAELKYLGMIKSSRKRADHLVKMRFLGL